MSYTPDPSTRDMPLTLEEAEQLAQRGGSAIAKPRLAAHFLDRVVATIKMHQEMLNKLHREVAIMQTKRSYQGGSPTTLSPRDAIKYLTPAERAEICDETSRQHLAALERKTGELESTRAELARALASVKLAVQGTLEHPELTDSVRSRLVELLSADPSQVGAPQAGAPQAGPVPSAAGPATTATPPAAPAPSAPTPPAAPNDQGPAPSPGPVAVADSPFATLPPLGPAPAPAAPTPDEPAPAPPASAAAPSGDGPGATGPVPLRGEPADPAAQGSPAPEPLPGPLSSIFDDPDEVAP